MSESIPPSVDTPRESILPQALDAVYEERNRVVAVLAKLVHSLRFTGVFEAHLARHPEEDKEWDDEWRWIVFIRLPAPWSQLSWHIHEKELGLFAFLPKERNDWDHHTTEEKFKRMEAFCNDDHTLNDACSICGISYSAPEEAMCEDCTASRMIAHTVARMD